MPKQELEAAPSHGEVPWLAHPNGRFYDHEKEVGEEVQARRDSGIVVLAQTHYYALQKAARRLSLAPEHITLEQSMKSYHVYVLQCTARKSGRVTLHVGIAIDVAARVQQHIEGKVKATRGRSITWLGNSQPMEHGDALRLEAELKKKSPAKKRAWASEQSDHLTGRSSVPFGDKNRGKR